MKAELVNHDGKGVVELKREDGQTFKVQPNVFSLDDQAFIKTWMEKNPPKIDYRLEVKVTPEKIAGQRRDFGYKKVKNEEWAYKVEVRNLSRDEAANLTVEYRVFAKNEAEGAYSSSEMGGFHKGQAAVKGPVRYNETATFTTKSVNIDFVDYDGAGYRYKDGLQGVMIRFKDAQGKVVLDYVSPTTSLQGKTWDTVPANLEVKARAGANN
ncbi:MAG: hypothetical protein KDM63_15390 [Verrucomicrobiae bacterium]|nr:hypothetical protein [Verrucomicrobiae bacterium]